MTYLSNWSAFYTKEGKKELTLIKHETFKLFRKMQCLCLVMKFANAATAFLDLFKHHGFFFQNSIFQIF